MHEPPNSILIGERADGLGLAAVAIDYIQSTLSGHWGYYWMRVQFETGVVLRSDASAVIGGRRAFRGALAAGLRDDPAVADLVVYRSNGERAVHAAQRRLRRMAGSLQTGSS